MHPRALALAAILGLATSSTAGDLPADEVRPRVEHHLRAANELADHFDAVIRSGCPRFTTTSQWDAYVNGETDKVVLLAAHVEQAWVEAKTTGDDEVRRAAKAPRRRLEEARALVAMLSGCAEANGTTLQTGTLFRQIEREVPRRQAEIALPPLPERP
ncbi:MAG TPA: hypothetical protein VID04_11960 [Methylomirabilota bacterium]|jgi:hypothetical protein